MFRELRLQFFKPRHWLRLALFQLGLGPGRVVSD